MAAMVLVVVVMVIVVMFVVVMVVDLQMFKSNLKLAKVVIGR